jgi:hypothetical protein
MDEARLLPADAARYAVLRRLAPALRHKLLGELHPIGMIADLTARRLQADAPDLDNLRNNIVKIKGQTQSAAASCSGLMSWVAPDPAASIAIGAGVAECIVLVTPELGMRGIDIVPNLHTGETLVARSALREVLVAAIFASTDPLTQPADLLLSDRLTGPQLELCLEVNSADRSVETIEREPFRTIGWDDVAALAAANKVEIIQAPRRVALRYAPLPPVTA